MREELLSAIETEVLTEENTDKLISLLMGMVPLPWYIPKGVLARILDKLFPDLLLKALRKLGES